MLFRAARGRLRHAMTIGLTAAVVAALLGAGTTDPPPARLAAETAPRARIIGGSEVADDAYPFMAALLLQNPAANDYRNQFCGGSLIAPDWVLTAAHCVWGWEHEGFDVVVGRTQLSDTGKGQFRHVEDVRIHPLYDPERGDYDVAAVQLEEAVYGITPVRLPTRGTDAGLRPGQAATVLGWGLTDDVLFHKPDRLHRVEVPLLAHEECSIAGGFDPATMVCAGREGRDACQGDSGGPLLRTVPGREVFYQIGVVHGGYGCGAQGGPGLYMSTGSARLMDTWPDFPLAEDQDAAAGS
ncbi:serine protease [Kitasatospora sp. NPDC001539]|uniref:S1 family peptidase n=1 Tax=Kitasatospora sp. NPDC001539 TaxID=3154384 RepID=UPI003332E680